MPIWWLWRTKPTPKGPKVVDTFELPWNYVPGDLPDRWQLVDDITEHVQSRISSGARSSLKRELDWSPAVQRSMAAFNIKQSGPGGKHFTLTPPIEKFADLTDFYPRGQGITTRGGRRVLQPQFWIQPEVFAATGDVFQGAAVDHLYPISFHELQELAKTNDAGAFVLTALDAYQETGRPRQSFLKASGARIKKTPAQLQREIDALLRKRG
jgi:hypothetical protein